MISISQHVKYIGVDDDNLDLFEGQYTIPLGISYNSYIIEGDKTAVMDAVDIRRCDQWLMNIEAGLSGRRPDYLIVQHMEPDHSGSINRFVEKYPSCRVVTSAKSLAMLGNFFEDTDFIDRTQTIREGDILDLGGVTLTFIAAPMVHWPEVMMTFCPEDGVLFSADAFGTFSTFDGNEAWDEEARRYYTNIVGKYGPNVQAVLKKAATLPISIICPLHGPVLRENLSRYISLYDKWSRYEPENPAGVLVAYASVYGGTAAVAHSMVSMLQARGVDDVAVLDLCRHDVSYAVSETFRLGKLLLASVTYDASLYPAMHDYLHHLQLKGMRGRKVGIIENGSWAPIAGKHMRDMLSRMKDMEVVEPSVTLRSRMHKDDQPALDALADALAK